MPTTRQIEVHYVSQSINPGIWWSGVIRVADTFELYDWIKAQTEATKPVLITSIRYMPD